MEHELPRPYQQKPATCLCPEPDQFSPLPKCYFLKINFNITPHLCLSLPCCLFSPKYPHQSPVCNSPLPRTCYTPRQSHSSSFLTKIIFAENYILCISSIGCPLRSPATCSPFGPNKHLCKPSSVHVAIRHGMIKGDIEE